MVGRQKAESVVMASWGQLGSPLSKETSHYGKITIQAGLNDCRNNETTPAEIVNKYQDVIQEAGKHCEHVTISSIIHCTKSKQVAAKIDTTYISLYLAHACSETANVNNLDNNGTFKLADGSNNESMIHDDGWHLSDRGTLQFIENLSLQATISKRDVRSHKEALDQPKQCISLRSFNHWNGKRPREQITSKLTQPPNFNIPNQNEDGLP